MNADSLGALLGVVLSLAFSYVPGLNGWFDGLEKSAKQAWVGVFLVLIAGGVFAASCAGLADYGVACTKEGALGFIQVLIAALVANQSTYLITKPGKPLG